MPSALSTPRPTVERRASARSVSPSRAQKAAPHWTPDLRRTIEAAIRHQGEEYQERIYDLVSFAADPSGAEARDTLRALYRDPGGDFDVERVRAHILEAAAKTCERCMVSESTPSAMILALGTVGATRKDVQQFIAQALNNQIKSHHASPAAPEQQPARISEVDMTNAACHLKSTDVHISHDELSPRAERKQHGFEHARQQLEFELLVSRPKPDHGDATRPAVRCVMAKVGDAEKAAWVPLVAVERDGQLDLAPVPCSS